MTNKDIEAILPLSPLQHGLLFHALRDRDEDPYFIQAGFALAGAFDRAIFSRAFELVARRHAILRSAFVWEKVEAPVQVVRKVADIPLREHDLRGMDEQAQREAIAQLLHADRSEGFALNKAPLMRLTLMRVADQVTHVYNSHHHLILDGWSFALVLREVLLTYHALARGATPALPPAPAYRDYLSWVGRRDREAAARFFRDTLAGFDTPTPLPLAAATSPRSAAHPELAFAEQEHVFTRAETQAIEALARALRVTLNTVVQAAFALLLSRHAGSRDVVFGSTVSGRPPELPGSDAMVGVLINTLPVPVRIDEQTTLPAFVGALQAHNAELRAFEWMPLADVQRCAQLAAGLPLFESIVVFDSYPEQAAESGGIEVQVLPRGAAHEGAALLSAGRNNYPLSLMVEPNAALKLICAYARDRLSHGAAHSVLRQLASLLGEMVARPHARLAELSTVCGQERARLLSELNAPTPAHELEGTVNARFEAQVARTPDAPALCCAGETLSYRELDARANAVAQRLIALGIGCDDRVGLCVERSIALIVGLLGALKAGAAYVPLDPKFPEERRLEILRDSGARALLTSGASAVPSALAELAWIDLDVQRVGALPPPAAQSPGDSSVMGTRRPARADSLAYVIYTSGSTGRPKGVGVEHRQLLHYLEAVWARLPMAELASFALVSTVAADLGHTSLFGALCSGRLLHVLPSEVAFDPDAFAASMAGAQVDALKIVPSHLAALLEATDPARVLPRRCLVLGGEAASPALLRRIRELAPACAVLNHYGPTEATVGALTHALHAHSPEPLPLGRPLDHVRAYVLGPQLELLPIGASGELCLSGLGVARGYHARPRLTAERFVPDPFATTPGARLYRTGDRARYREDGELEFLGRLDHQLKVRGNRVELGEIEARLVAQPDVREAVVIARADAQSVRLIGYVVAPKTIDLEVVRGALERSLPDYMVPSALVRLDALPLTANGKIDRAALPEPDSTQTAEAFCAPRTALEQTLAEVWCGVLGLEQISVHDNFFARGGDSIRSLQVIARMNQRGIKLSPKQLFQHPTIAEIAGVARVTGASPAMPAAATKPTEPAAFSLTGLTEAELARALPDLDRLQDAYPLSPMQEGMLFHTRLQPHSGIYLMQQHYAWSGALDLARVTEAWRLVAERHPILRTAFAWDGLERPLQCVYSSIDMSEVVRHIDLRELAAAEQEARIRATLEQELNEGLDMTRAPLMRVRLFQLGDSEYRIVRSFHHILTDDWCFSVLMMECLRFYAALSEGRTLSLPAPRPYRDYIAWLAQKDARAAEAFYREQLRGFMAPTPLGIERTVPDASVDGVGDVFFELEPSVSETLMTLAQTHALTPNTFVQGAWAVLLSRYAQTRNVLFGVTVAGRPTDLPGVETIVGLFINSLPLRVQVDAAQQLVPWLRELLAENYRVREHEHAPLVNIQQWSELPHGEPLFKSLLVFENAPQDPELGAQVREVEVSFDGDRVHTNYPLTVVAYPGARIGVRISFDRRRFAQEAVEQMLAHLRALLQDMAARPNVCVGELNMLSAAERARELETFNPKTRAPAPSQSYTALFEAQVRRTPDAVAVRCRGRELSYDALNRAANRVAHALRAAGVRADQVVAVLEPRELELLVSMLGVLKAGGAYLPLDPKHPRDRLAQVLQQSGARLVVSAERLAVQAREAAGERARVLVREQIEQARGPVENLELPCDPRMLAYVIFTSGSTGTPKGAMVEHAGMLNNVHGKLPALELGARDVVAQTASQCFDISVWQLLSPLLAGARVQIIEDDVVRDPRALLAEIDAQHVSVLELVPGLIRELIEAAAHQANPLAHVRCLLPTGEALTPELSRQWFARFPRIPLINAYGPAECADDVALHRITSAPPANVVHMPIGRPVPHVRLYVASGEEVAPLGVAGELCVAGVGVGRGYIGSPSRTAEVFVPDPFSGVPGARMYRTGDLARRASDGTLTFVGRRDHQVKVRGHRIELGEIEARLAALSGIAEATVVVRDERGRGPELVAYVVRERAIELEAVKRELAESLPSAMIPSAFVWLDALPRSQNGKVDRARLPAPQLEDTCDAPPEGELEQRLAAIWCDVLGVPQVGRNSHFFALGGHSLLATRVVARVREQCGIDLPLRSVFDAPVLRDLARELAAAARPTNEQVPLVPVPRTGPLPVSYAQHRLWFLSQLENDPAAYNMSTAVKVEGRLDAAALQRAWRLLHARHEALETTFVVVDGEPMQQVQTIEPAFGSLDLRALPPQGEREQALQRAAQQHVAEPFDLERGPLARLLHLQLSASEHALVLALHHIVADGWSLNLLVRDLSQLYAAEVSGSTAQLPAPVIQYADFAVWQRRWMESARAAQLAYWSERLRDAPVLDLRPDNPRSAGESVRALSGRHVQELEPALLAALRATPSGATLFMQLLAAYKVVLAQRTGQHDVLVGTDVANRRRAETEDIVGFFVNLLALRTSLAGDPSLAEVVARVRETTLDAYAHQDLPFEQVVDAVQPVREPGRHPIVQTLFVLQNTPNAELVLEGVRFQPLELEQETSRFDLGVFAEELPDGLLVTWKYRRDLFEPETVAALAAELERTLRALAQDPGQRLSALATERKRARSQEQRAKLQRIRSRASAAAPTRPLVSMRPLEEHGLPLLIEPDAAEVDLAAWARSERAQLEQLLLRHGAILLRGFGLRTVAEFEHAAEAIAGQLYGEYGDLPREKSGGRQVYGSTPYPEDETILFHNESSHLPRWPRKQLFFCAQPAREGGATPIVDCRRMLTVLAPEIVERFERLGLHYVRNFVPGFDVAWQDFFQTDQRAMVNARCAREGMTATWLEGDRLRISQRGPGVITHPISKERSFFNQVQLHHPDYLSERVRSSLLALVGEEGLPRNVTYADGCAIDRATSSAIGEAYERCAVRFAWRAGDLLLLDNMLVAHARDPFRGARKIVVAMGDMQDRASVEAKP